jgi:hypothetical protein
MTAEQEKLYADLAKITGIDVRPIIRLSEEFIANGGKQHQLVSVLLSWTAACAVAGGTSLDEAVRFFSYFMNTLLLSRMGEAPAPKPPTDSNPYVN